MKRADFHKAKAQFQTHLRTRVFPPKDGWLTVPAEAVCWTAGCKRYGTRIRFDSAGVNADDKFRLYCGSCSQLCWDIYLLHDDGPEHVEQAREGIRTPG